MKMLNAMEGNGKFEEYFYTGKLNLQCHALSQCVRVRSGPLTDSKSLNRNCQLCQAQTPISEEFDKKELSRGDRKH